MVTRVKPDESRRIDIFYEGDENVTEVCFENPDKDLKWVLNYFRRGDKRPYSVPLREEEDNLIWTVTLADTAKPGMGIAQLVGSGEDQTKHSGSYSVFVGKSLVNPGDVPAVDKAFLDKVAKEAAEAQTAARVATDSAVSATKAARDGQALYNQVRADLAEGKLKGDPGPAGPRGEKGDKGEPGTPGLDAPQIDDAVVSGESPWSSKKIIETLCPPISESGNPVTCEPVAGYPLGVVASWEPRQEGSGDPSPDNIRPIVGRDAVTVERCGINLLDISAMIPGFIKNDLTIAPQTLNTLVSDYIRVMPSTTYTYACGGYSQQSNHDWTAWAYYQDNAGQVSNIIPTRQAAEGKNYTGSTWTFTTPADCHYIRISSRHIAIAGSWAELICGASAPTTPIPYSGARLRTTMPRQIYGGAVDMVAGDGLDEWITYTITGNEQFVRQSLSAGAIIRFFFILSSHKLPAPFVVTSYNTGNILCNQYPAVPLHSSVTGELGGIAMGETGANVYFYDKSRQSMTLADWKSWLAAQYAAGTPVQIAYKLAKPVPFQATGNAEIMPIPGETNTITTDADSVTVTGRADPIRIIQQLQAAQSTAAVQIAETQQQIVDTTAMAVDYIYEQDSQIFGGDDNDSETDAMPT